MTELEEVQKTSPHGYCIFCEDIRQEINGKETLIGVMGNEMLVLGALPAIVGKFMIKVVYTQRPSDPLVPLIVEVTMPGEDAPGASINVDLARSIEGFPPMPPDTDDPFLALQFAFAFDPLEVKKEGAIRVRAIREGKIYRLGAIRVRQHPPISSAPLGEAAN